MPELVTHPNGKPLRLVATRTTTPMPANAPKPVYVKRGLVEVIVSEPMRHLPASAFGHVAIAVDGMVYSRAHERYFTEPTLAYLRRQAFRVERSSIGLVLWVGPGEKEDIKRELQRRVAEDKPYSLTQNSCSTNVADVLEMVGVLAHDPRGLPTPVTPEEMLAVLGKSKRLVQKQYYKAKAEPQSPGASGNW